MSKSLYHLPNSVTLLNVTQCCLRWHLWIVSCIGKTVVNRLLGKGWSNLNDFNSRQMATAGWYDAVENNFRLPPHHMLELPVIHI